MFQRSYRVLAGCILSVTLCIAVYAPAQVSTASITGVVEDSTGARIPGAIVKLINTLTGTENNSETGHYGEFLLPGVIPGAYILEIERNGFATVEISGLVLNVGESRNLLIRMQVGPITQTVKINGSGILLNTADASVSTVVNRTFVANIPLNGRSFQDLISMTPGVLSQNPQAFGITGSSYGVSVNGQRPDTNSYMVDGVSANFGIGSLAGHHKVVSIGDIPGTTALGTTQSLASVDDLQEFRVLGSSYSAEYGRTPGGQFTLLTRSGTNAIHGSAYDYLRKSVYDASDWFQKFYPSEGPLQNPYHQQDFGATLGTPIPIPEFGKTFLFSSYEGFRVYQPTAPWVEFLPSPDLRANAPPALQPVLNAFSFSGGSGQLPIPSDTGLLALIVPPYSLPSTVNATSIRLDHAFSEKMTTFFRYSDTPSESESEVLSSLTTNRLRSETFTFGANAQLSAAIADDFRLGYARSNGRSSSQLDNRFVPPGLDLNQALGIPASDSSAASEAYIHVASAGESAAKTDDASGSLHQWNLRNTVSVQAAHHLLQIGIDERHIVTNLNPPALSVEADFFDRPSLERNLASDISITRSVPATPVLNEFAAFIQDEWRVSKSLTLSPGLRWEVDPAPHGKDGEDAYTLLGTLASPQSLRLAPRGTDLWKTSWFNLAPRLGAAWIADAKPGRELVIRAGGGVFFDTDNRAAAEAFSALGFSATMHPEDVPVPVTPAQLDFSVTPASPYTSTAAFLFPRHLQLPYTFQWNVSVEKALGRNQAFTTSWVGATGHRLLMQRRTNVNSENPEFGEVDYFPGDITSNYEALQMKFQRSVSPGIQALATYTWSHALDYGSTDPAWPLTYGNSDFDVRQNLEAAVSWNERALSGNLFRKYILGGWGADARLSARSAFPVTPLGNLFSDPATGNLYWSGVNLIPGRPLYLHGSEYPGGRIFNGGPNATNPAFVLPNVGAAGDAPRNMLRGFGEEQVNLALRREIPLGGRFGVQIRAEAYNVFNHPDLGYIDPSVTDYLFGQAMLMLNQSFGPTGSLYEPGGPRSVQVSLRLHF